jgi:hypothetical protein
MVNVSGLIRICRNCRNASSRLALQSYCEAGVPFATEALHRCRIKMAGSNLCLEENLKFPKLGKRIRKHASYTQTRQKDIIQMDILPFHNMNDIVIICKAIYPSKRSTIIIIQIKFKYDFVRSAKKQKQKKVRVKLEKLKQ